MAGFAALVKTDQEIKAMRRSGQINAKVLQVVKKAALPGMSTKELADIAASELKRLGGKPAFLGYNGFPDVLCVSLNDEVVHGIPSKLRLIKDGDIISIDFGVVYDKMITDHAITFTLGNANQRAKQLIQATEVALMAGIGVLKDGVRVGDIANAVEKVLKKNHLGIVRDLVGHGTGHYLHEEPNIPNYGRAHTGPVLQAGMTIAIEPMATLGTDRVYVEEDGWTIRSGDRSLAAHFEHTILITDDGFEILT